MTKMNVFITSSIKFWDPGKRVISLNNIFTFDACYSQGRRTRPGNSENPHIIDGHCKALGKKITLLTELYLLSPAVFTDLIKLPTLPKS